MDHATPGMIVSLTPANAFSLEEVRLLNECRISPLYVFEFVLAMWPSMKSLMELREDLLYEQLAAELGDTIVADWCETEIDTMFPQRYDAIYQLIKRLYERLIPHFASITDGLPGRPVQTVTYQPFSQQASFLRFHIDDTL